MPPNDAPTTIERIRETIDEADSCLLNTIAMRFEAVGYLRDIKTLRKLPVTDTRRENDVKDHWKALAKELGLREEFVLLILDFVLHESKRIQGVGQNP